MSGFIVMARDATEHPLLKDGERFRAWFWMVAKACWKPTPFDINGKVVHLKRGQLCASRSQIAEALGWSPSAVERFLTRLQTEQMIGRETGQGRSIITICNYGKYQDITEKTGQATGQENGQRSDSDRTAKEQGNQLPLSNDNGAGDFWKFAIGYLGQKKRPLIGKWCSAYGQPETAKAITEAQVNRAVEPIAYIEKILRGQSTGPFEYVGGPC